MTFFVLSCIIDLGFRVGKGGSFLLFLLATGWVGPDTLDG
jgi:hypothetical protein